MAILTLEKLGFKKKIVIRHYEYILIRTSQNVLYHTDIFVDILNFLILQTEKVYDLFIVVVGRKQNIGLLSKVLTLKHNFNIHTQKNFQQHIPVKYKGKTFKFNFLNL